MNGCAAALRDAPGAEGGPVMLEPDRIDRVWRRLSALQRVECALDQFPAAHVMSSSFGVQSAVMLHLVTRVSPGIPVIFVDTGYHFAQTYRFVDEITDRLSLNLRIARCDMSPAWQEARHGKRWEQGSEGLRAYNLENKVRPMQDMLRRLDAATWFSGLRRSQASTRADLAFVGRQWGRLKVHPIADWSDRDVHRYLQAHDLPYHPLREKGYLSIGDWHTTRSIHEVDDEEQMRFFGLTRECGLHEQE